MKLLRFQLFPARKKLVQVLTNGQYLLQRTGRTGPVSLYYLRDGAKGFFAEVAYDTRWCRATFLRSFRRPQRLHRYLSSIQLPVNL